MKLELLVIVYKYETVNSEPNLVHTARHAMEAGFILTIYCSYYFSKHLLNLVNLINIKI